MAQSNEQVMTVSNSKSVADVLRAYENRLLKNIGMTGSDFIPELTHEQALAAIQEIIEGAKPERSGFDEFSGGFKNGVNQYEQNLRELLK